MPRPLGAKNKPRPVNWRGEAMSKLGEPIAARTGVMGERARYAYTLQASQCVQRPWYVCSIDMVTGARAIVSKCRTRINAERIRERLEKTEAGERPSKKDLHRLNHIVHPRRKPLDGGDGNM